MTPRKIDPRLYQISVLAVLLLYGAIRLDFDLRLQDTIAILASVLSVQYICTRYFKLPAFDPRSPLISGLSLCLLLRTNYLILAIIAAVITIAAKFILRWNGKHLFNPTNFGLVVILLATDSVWVSPGQWGSTAFFGFLLACIGGLVVNRSTRSDVTYAFLGSYICLLLLRSLWLGDPLSIAFHQVQNGAFLIFTFFMISDPKTTPDSRSGRIAFAAIIAAAAIYMRFYLYWTNALLWSLALVSFFTPVIDACLPGKKYDWPQRNPKSKGNTDEKSIEIPTPNLAGSPVY